MDGRLIWVTATNDGRRSTDRVLRVLMFLASRAEPVSGAAIGRECAIPKQTLYPMLHDMSERGFVLYLPDSKCWGLGITAFEIGSAYLRSEPLQRIGRPVLAKLTDSVGETSHLAVLHGNEALYLLKHSPPRLVLPLISDVGVRLPAHLTAVGRAILMKLKNNQLRALYPNQAAFVQRTGRGSRTLSELHVELLADRQRGFSVESDLTSEGVTCIAAPVCDRLGTPVTSVGISFETRAHAEAEWDRLGVEVRATANLLAQRVQGRVAQ